MQIVRSQAPATAAGEVSIAAPAATSGSSFFASMSCTTSEKPAFARLSAIGPPILPSPMNPTLPGIISLLACCDGDRYSGGGRKLLRGDDATGFAALTS